MPYIHVISTNDVISRAPLTKLDQQCQVVSKTETYCIRREMKVKRAVFSDVYLCPGSRLALICHSLFVRVVKVSHLIVKGRQT